MTAVKKTISIDEQVAKDASDMGPNFSAVVETALIEYIQQHRIKKAMNSFGKWTSRKESSAKIVKTLRQQDDRESVTRRDSGKSKE